MYLKKYVTKSKRIVLHPNFGLVNEGVRPLLFTKPGISLNQDSVLYKKKTIKGASFCSLNREFH